MDTIGENIELLQSVQNPKVKHGLVRDLLAAASIRPEAVYPYFDRFVELLKSQNKILKCTAIDVIGLLSKVDKENKVDAMVGKLTTLVKEGKLITANHAISALSAIASAKPRFKQKVAGAFLKAEQYNYETTECKNIVLGKVIEAIRPIAADVTSKNEIMGFVKRQTRNARNSTRKKAQQFLKRWESNTRKKTVW